MVYPHLPPSRRPPPSPSEISTSPPASNPSYNDSSSSSPSSDGGIGTGSIVGIVAVLGFLLLAVIIGVSCSFTKRKKRIAGHNGFHDTPTSMTNSPRSDLGLLKIQTSTLENGNLFANDYVNSPHDTMVE